MALFIFWLGPTFSEFNSNKPCDLFGTDTAFKSSEILNKEEDYTSFYLCCHKYYLGFFHFLINLYAFN